VHCQGRQGRASHTTTWQKPEDLWSCRTTRSSSSQIGCKPPNDFVLDRVAIWGNCTGRRGGGPVSIATASAFQDTSEAHFVPDWAAPNRFMSVSCSEIALPNASSMVWQHAMVAFTSKVSSKQQLQSVA